MSGQNETMRLLRKLYSSTLVPSTQGSQNHIKINKITCLGGKTFIFHQLTSWGFAQQNVLMSLKKDLNVICSSCKNTFFSLLFLCWRFMARLSEDMNGGKSSSALVTRLLQGGKWGYFSPEEGLVCLKASLFFTVSMHWKLSQGI